MPHKFDKHICKEKNFLYLNGKNVLKPRVVEIITEFLNEDENKYKELKNNLSSYKSIFQYVYSNVFPKIYCSTGKRGFDLKSKKTQKTMKTYVARQTFINKNPSTLMILMRSKRKKLKDVLKNKTKKGERSLKKINY